MVPRSRGATLIRIDSRRAAVRLQDMPRVVVLQYSVQGRTRALAEAIARGAASAGCDTAVVSVEAPDWAVLDAADALVFGAPTYLGSLAAPMKAFLETTSGRFRERTWRDKLAAGFTHSSGLSGDKLLALVQLVVFAQQQGMVWVGQAELPSGTFPEHVNRLSSYTGLMAQTDPGMPTPQPGDLLTAEAFGARIAAAAKRWSAGASAVSA